MYFFFFFLGYNIKGTISSETFVFDVLRVYVLLHICVEANFVDFKEFCGLMTYVQNN